jgi:acyl carrier protein
VVTAVTFEQVAERISALVSVSAAKLTPQTALDDLALDSARLVETVVDLQEEFGSTFSQAAFKQVSTLGELAELLRAGSAEAQGTVCQH